MARHRSRRCGDQRRQDVARPWTVRCSPGQPDIKDGPRLVGFIETKPPDTPRVLRSERQLKRYRQLLPNWILTDYRRFMIIREGEVTRRFEIEEENPEALVSGFVDFPSYAAPVLRSPRRLAQELARRARLLRDALEMLVNKEPADGNLRNVLGFYKQTLMAGCHLRNVRIRNARSVVGCDRPTHNCRCKRDSPRHLLDGSPRWLHDLSRYVCNCCSDLAIVGKVESAV